MNKALCIFLLSILALALCARPAHGQTVNSINPILSNMEQAGSSEFCTPGNGYSYAAHFTSGDSETSVDGIILHMSNPLPGNQGTLRVSINEAYQQPGQGIRPGQEIAAFNNPEGGVFGPTRDFIFELNEPVMIQANSHFFIVVATTNELLGPHWRGRGSSSDFNGSGSFTRSWVSDDNGATWTNFSVSSGGITIFNYSSNAARLRLEPDVSVNPDIISLPVNLESNGDIQGVSFSIQFDSQVFQNPVFQLSDEFMNAQLIENDTNAETGSYSAGIAFSGIETFPGQSVEIGLINLSIRSGFENGFTSLSFVDDPVQMEAVTSTGNPVNLETFNQSVLVNNAPVSVGDNFQTNEDQAVAINLQLNDSDDDGDPLSVAIVSPPGSGAVEVLPDGTVLYTPLPDFNGTDSFTYLVNDSFENSNVATVTMTVLSVDDLPEITGGTEGFGLEDDPSPIAGALEVSDVDGLNGTQIFAIHADSQIGNASIDAATGEWTFSPAPNAHGLTAFTVRIADDDGFTFDQEISISITEVDDPVQISGELSGVIDEDGGTVSGTLLAVDDADGLSRTDIFSVGTDASGGSVSIGESTGVWSYTPALNFNGSDEFVVVITDDNGHTAQQVISITVNQVDDLLTIQGDITGTGSEDTIAVTGTIIALDPADGLTNDEVYSISISPENGSASIDAVTGDWSYIPSPDFHGNDEFGVNIQDDDGNIVLQSVELIITPVDDPLSLGGDLSGVGDEDRLIGGIITASDSADGLTDGDYFSITSQPVNGSVVIGPASGHWDYTPATNFHGEDSFEVTVTDDDGFTDAVIIVVTINSVDDPLEVTGGNDASGDEDTTITDILDVSDPDGLTSTDKFTVSEQPSNGSAAIDASTGSWSYQPDADFNGLDQFVVQVTDDDGYASPVTVNLSVNAVPDSPLAFADSYQTLENGIMNITAQNGLLANDSHPDGTDFSVDISQGEILSSNGATILLNEDGSFSFDGTGVPALIMLEPGEKLTDSFEYTIIDANNTPSTAPASVSIEVTGVGFEGDLTGLEVNEQSYEDNSLDVLDFTQAGRYLIQIDPLGDTDRLFSSVDTWPVETGGDGRISLSDWIQTGRYVAGLDPITVKSGPTRRVDGSGSQLSADESDPPWTDAGIARMATQSSASQDPAEIVISGQNFQAGEKARITIGIQSKGNVSGIGFSLSFDPSLMQYLSGDQVSAPGSNSLTTFINDLRAGHGHLGVVISSGPAQPIPAGYRELLELEFDLSIDHHSGPPEISLTDRVVRTALSNAIARRVGYSLDSRLTPTRTIRNYGEWIRAHLTKNNPGQEPGNTTPEEIEDSDGDGLTNEVEFLLGTSPFEMNSLPVKTVIEQEDEQTIVEVTTSIIRERGDLQVEILTSNDLGEGFQSSSQTSRSSTTQHGREKRGLRINTSSEYQFFIIRVNRR